MGFRGSYEGAENVILLHATCHSVFFGTTEVILSLYWTKLQETIERTVRPATGCKCKARMPVVHITLSCTAISICVAFSIVDNERYS